MRVAFWVGAATVLLLTGPAVGQPVKPEVRAKLSGHRGGISSMAISPRGDWILTGSGNGVVRVWDAKTGELIGKVDDTKHNGARINHVGFSANGQLLSSSSKNIVAVWGVAENIPDPKADPMMEPKIEPKNPPGKRLVFIAEDPYSSDPNKIGTITGDGRRFYYGAPEGIRTGVGSQPLASRYGSATTDEFRGSFIPWAVAAMPDPESGLVAMYGGQRGSDGKTEGTIAFVGLGEGKIIGRGTVRNQTANRPVSISFAPDGKWLVACNGSEVMYWKVPGSQVVTGDPKLLPNTTAYVATAGPGGRIAFATPPEEGKKVTVMIVDLTSTEPKLLAEFDSGMDRVSALAFSPGGTTLAVADDAEGIVELWRLAK